MIRITIELIPPLITGMKGKEIARAEIVNEGTTGTKKRGDYRFVLWGKQTSAWRVGQLKDFPRESYNVWKLLYLILKQVFE